MFADIATVIAPVFICAGVGFFWDRFGPTFDTQVIGGMALTVGMPCLIFSSLTRLNVSPDAFGVMAGAYGLAILCFAAAGVMTIRLMRLPATTFLPSFIASNTGNMGLPLCLFAFGEKGLALAVCIFVVTSVFSFTVGWTIYSGRLSLEALYRNPLVYAILAAAAFVTAGIEPPRWLTNTTDILGKLAIPLMLISLGVSIARMRIGGVKRTVALSVLKLVVGFGVGLGLAEALGLTGAARGVFIIECSMPVAAHNYILALRFSRSPEEVASLIMLSTIISLATLPALMWVVL